jgi:hypothetical protein
MNAFFLGLRDLFAGIWAYVQTYYQLNRRYLPRLWSNFLLPHINRHFIRMRRRFQWAAWPFCIGLGLVILMTIFHLCGVRLGAIICGFAAYPFLVCALINWLAFCELGFLAYLLAVLAKNLVIDSQVTALLNVNKILKEFGKGAVTAVGIKTENVDWDKPLDDIFGQATTTLNTIGHRLRNFGKTGILVVAFLLGYVTLVILYNMVMNTADELMPRVGHTFALSAITFSVMIILSLGVANALSKSSINEGVSSHV